LDLVPGHARVVGFENLATGQADRAPGGLGGVETLSVSVVEIRVDEGDLVALVSSRGHLWGGSCFLGSTSTQQGRVRFTPASASAPTRRPWRIVHGTEVEQSRCQWRAPGHET